MLWLDARPIAEAETLSQAVAHVALHNPSGVAAESNREKLTFKELFERAFALRCKLSDCPGATVPVLADCGICLRVAILAVLLNGGTPLVVDPAAPAKDVAKALDDLQVTDVLVTVAQLGALSKLKSQLNEERASALRALSLTSTSQASVPIGLVRSVKGVDGMISFIDHSGKLTTQTEKHLLRTLDESNVSTVLDSLVVLKDASRSC